MEQLTPTLSVILRIVGGGKFLVRCLRHLCNQNQAHLVEIIVPFDSACSEIPDIRSAFPKALFLDIGHEVVFDTRNPGSLHEQYDLRTAAGLNIARGKILALLEDYAIPDPDWCEQIIAAHDLSHGVIGGAIEQAGSGCLNWAVYFLDFGRYALPLKEGPSVTLSDVNISYKRKVLSAIKPVWKNSYNEVTVNWALAKQGESLWLRPQIIVREDRDALKIGAVIAERFAWGKIFGRKRTPEITKLNRWKYILLAPLIPLILIGRVSWKVFRDKRNRFQFLVCLPVLMVFSIVWTAGEFVGTLEGVHR